MELVYLYIDGYRKFQEAEFNFGQDVKIHFDKEFRRLRVEQCEPALPSDFWGGNIRNLTMLIGNNGAGKTSVFQYTISVLQEIWEETTGAADTGIGICVFKDGESLFWHAGDELWGEVHFSWENARDRKLVKKTVELTQENVFQILGETKFIYLTGSLSRDDYQRGQMGNQGRNSYLYDCSVGNLICQDNQMDVNRFTRENRTYYSQGDGEASFSEIWTYFLYEQYKQIKFVFDRNQFKTLEQMKADGYPVPVPRVLHIELALDKGSDRLRMGKSAEAEWSIRQMEDELQSVARKRIVRSDKRLAPIEFLRLQLMQQAVLCAFYSEIRLMDGKSLLVALPIMMKRLPLSGWGRGSFREIFEIVWDAMGSSASEAVKADSSWKILRRCESYYIDFLQFIEQADLEQHFSMETELSGDADYDMDELSLKFSVSTSDAEWFMQFIQKYRYICNPDYFLDFHWGLSSGEYNLLSMFSSLYYIYDADYTNKKNGEYTIWNVGAGRHFNEGKKECDSVILMIDEADLSYHPEWQRQYISILTAFLPRIYPKKDKEGCQNNPKKDERGCQNIQIILSTHSPLLLGDVPQQNVICLSCDPDGDRVRVDKRGDWGTFGQNIHLLFKDSFFLENGTLGQFAQDKINGTYEELIRLEEEMKETRKNLDLWRQKKEEYRKVLNSRYKKIAELIGEPLIRGKMIEKTESLLHMLDSETQKQSRAEREYRQMSEEQLRRHIALLEEELKTRQRENK